MRTQKEIIITEETIQSKVDGELPFVMTKLNQTISISSAKVKIKSPDLITVNLNGTAKLLGKDVSFIAKIVASVVYQNGSFYCEPLDVEMDYNKTLDEIIKDQNIAKLASFAFKKALELGVVDEEFKKTVISYVRHKISLFPIYTLERGLYRTSIKKITFTKGQVHIIVSTIELVKVAFIVVLTVVLTGSAWYALITTGGSFLK